MPTDREALEAMFDRVGINYDDDPDEAGCDRDGVAIHSAIMIPARPTPNFGYSGFVSVALFGADGELVGWGAWE